MNEERGERRRAVHALRQTEERRQNRTNQKTRRDRAEKGKKGLKRVYQKKDDRRAGASPREMNQSTYEGQERRGGTQTVQRTIVRYITCVRSTLQHATVWYGIGPGTKQEQKGKEIKTIKR